MASISGVKTSVGVRNVSVTTTIAENDVARLMYYLNCVLKSCGLDIVQDDLVDYKNYHRLTTRREDLVFFAAFKYSPDELIDKTIFHDTDGSVCAGNHSNVFLEISESMKLFHAQQNVLIMGEQKRASKIMVFKTSWIEQFYTEPMKRNLARVTRIVGGVISNHCEHCAGKTGKCVCLECPRTAQSQCSPSLKVTGIMSSFVESLKESIRENEKTLPQHCTHCKGLDAACGCKEGCAKPANAECTTIHETVSCDGCAKNQIIGSRYKCGNCDNYDLCQDCYMENKHAVTHRFFRINQVGSKWALLDARLKQEPKQEPKLPPHVPAPVQESAAQESRVPSSRKAFFYEDMSIRELKSYLTENGVRCAGILEKEELCKKVWECYCDSVSAAELAAVMKEAGVDTSGHGSISARRNAAKAAFRSISRSQVTSGAVHQKDSRVVLCGLKTARLNGSKGKVSNPSVDGRVEVVLDGSGRVILVKAENLRSDAEIID